MRRFTVNPNLTSQLQRSFYSNIEASANDADCELPQCFSQLFSQLVDDLQVRNRFCWMLPTYLLPATIIFDLFVLSFKYLLIHYRTARPSLISPGSLGIAKC